MRASDILPVLLLWGVSSAPLAAQPGAAANPESQELSSRDAPVTFTTRTNLVLVPVVVRDRQGRAVGNLRQEDFQLLDKGKPQIITKFTIENTRTPKIVPVADPAGLVDAASAVESTGAPSHFVAYLFDDLHSPWEDLSLTRQAAEKHLDRSLDRATRAAIYTTSGQTTLEFTDDRSRLRETLLRLRPQSGSNNNGISSCPQLSYYLGDLIENKHDSQAMQAMILETIQCAHLDPSDVETAKHMVESAARTEVVFGEQKARLALISLKDIVRRLSAAPGSRNLVVVSSGFFLTPSLRSDETEVMDRAIRANVTVSSLDARGLYTVIPGGSASERGVANPATAALRSRIQNEEASANANVLAEIADATGGRFFHNSNGLEQGFDQLAAQPEYIYVLGFSPQNLKFDGSFHNLKVMLRSGKGLDLQARRGYHAPAHARDPAEQAREEFREAVFSLEEMRDLPVDLNLQFFKSGDYAAKLSVVARLDIKQIRFRKDEDRNRNTITMVAAVFDQNGNMVNAIQKTIELRLRDQTLETVSKSGMSVRTVLDVTPGRYVVRLVVRDSEGEMMAARNGAIQIP